MKQYMQKRMMILRLHTIVWFVGLILLLLLLPTACGTTTQSEPKRVLSAGLALGRGGLGDRSFNDSAYEGLKKGSNEYGIRFHEIDFSEDNEQVSNLRMLVGEQHDVIIALGMEYVAAIKTVAAEYPDQRFAIIDATVEAPNVTSIVFVEQEGDFLAGALAALLSETKTVGFLGGADIPIIRRIEQGWTQGVRHIVPDATILVEYVSGKDDFSGFNKPAVGMELTVGMYQQGADVVYAAAGSTALGAIEAAKQEQHLIITTGSDQRWLLPEYVVTSRTKNMDVAVFTILEELKEHRLQPGVRELNFRDGGVGLAPLDSPLISQQVRERMKQLEQQIKSGEIIVEL